MIFARQILKITAAKAVTYSEKISLKMMCHKFKLRNAAADVLTLQCIKVKL